MAKREYNRLDDHAYVRILRFKSSCFYYTTTNDTTRNFVSMLCTAGNK